MSKIRFGPAIEDLRGSTGPLTFSRNTSAHYLARRRHKTPSITPAAVASRAALPAAAAAWRNLTPNQREDWNDYAAAPPESDYDPWNENRYLSGFTWFLRVYNRQLTTAQPAPTDPPPDPQPETTYISNAVIAPAGSANAASYISFQSNLENLLTNGSFEAPYTNGIAHDWTHTPAENYTPSENTTDFFSGSSSQQMIAANSASTARINSNFFTATTLPNHLFHFARKAISGTQPAFYLVSPPYTTTLLEPTSSYATWTEKTVFFTPPAAGNSRIQIFFDVSTTGTSLSDFFHVFPPRYYILSASISPSPGRQTPAHSFKLIHAAKPTALETIDIGDSFNAAFGAYPAGWTVFLSLYTQDSYGLRSTPQFYTTITG